MMPDKVLVDKGYIQVYTGLGKGKSTAALGLAFRAIGYGLKVYVGQFMKGIRYSEIACAEMLGDHIVIERFGEDTMVHPDKPGAKDFRRAENGLKKIKEAMLSGKYQLVIFDEINVTVAYGLLDEEKVLEVLKQKPVGVELVLTGISAPESFIKIADLVSEVQEVKHYYKEQGILSRLGIDR